MMTDLITKYDRHEMTPAQYAARMAKQFAWGALFIAAFIGVLAW